MGPWLLEFPYRRTQEVERDPEPRQRSRTSHQAPLDRIPGAVPALRPRTEAVTQPSRHLCSRSTRGQHERCWNFLFLMRRPEADRLSLPGLHQSQRASRPSWPRSSDRRWWSWPGVDRSRQVMIRPNFQARKNGLECSGGSPGCGFVKAVKPNGPGPRKFFLRLLQHLGEK